MVYRTPPVAVRRSPTPRGTGYRRDRVDMPLWTATRASGRNCVSNTFAASPIGTARIRSALLLRSYGAVMGVVVPGRFRIVVVVAASVVDPDLATVVSERLNDAVNAAVEVGASTV